MQYLPTPITFTIAGATAATGLSKTKLYGLIGSGILSTRKAGRTTLIVADSLNAYLSSLPPAAVRAGRKSA